jgi:CRISPR/Cas system CSM-associated protein Csm3 (group 7 of RAMP superfamily)
MTYKGQLGYTDGTRTKVQFHYTKGGSKADSKALEVEKLPAELREKLAKNPKGLGCELPVDDHGRIDLAELVAPQSPASRNPSQGGGGGFGQRPAQLTGQPRTILRVDDNSVFFTDGQDILREKINVTDPSLGLQPGNVVGPGNSLVPLERFGSSVNGLNGQKPDIDRNPYNFVEFAADAPWTERTPELTHAHPTKDRLSGVLQYEMKALTPLFVPAGFPFKAEESDAVRQQPRHFMRMADAEDAVLYAIPGSSIKGVVRSEIEALSNSRLGVLLDDDFFARPIPYRRRSFAAGVVAGHDPTRKGWEVQPVRVLYMSKGDWPRFPAPGTSVKYEVRPGTRRNDHKDYAFPNPAGRTGQVRKYFGGLAVAETNKPYGGLIVENIGPRVFLPDACVDEYFENLKHPHYEHHPDHAAEGFYRNINASIRKGLKADDLIYYTEEAGKITTFGKNINYLWPSSRSVTDLCGNFQVPKSKDGKQEILGLTDPLSMAERLFGFSGAHTKDGKSHPFRGLLRFETAWGPKAATYEEERQWPVLSRQTPPHAQAATGWKIELAPLTGPQTRAKSRPLYLQPGPNGKSASWEDRPAPKLRGRKFYWPQSDGHSAGKIWKFHLKDAAHVASQLPPPVYALKEETSFKGKIHFRNLAPEELGALIFALQGADDGKGYDHTLRIGKGKPRGLGNVKCQVTKIELDADPRLLLDGTWTTSDCDGKTHVEKFQAWVKKKAGIEFWQADYIKSYCHLHHWRDGSQIRYYPINFAEYGWLPGTAKNNTKGDPDRERPPAMKRAGSLT